MTWRDLDLGMSRKLHATFGEPVTLADVELRAIVDRAADVQIGDVYETRIVVEILRDALQSAEQVPVKGMAVVIGSATYRLDQRIDSGDEHAQKWVLR